MVQASVDGKPAPLATAIAEAAALLGASRCPLIAGLGTDVAGARAAVMLAARIGAAVDHMHANALLRDLDVMRGGGGVMITTPGEARLRGDVLLLMGPGLTEAWPALPDHLLGAPLADATRRIVWLCPSAEAKALSARFPDITRIGRDQTELPSLLAALRARVAGRPVSVATKPLDRIAADLKAARFGVAVWSAATLDALAIEMLCGLVADLNAATRFSGLPLAPADNAMGVLQACGWMTGFPMRSGFGRGYPEHDPWRFDAQRMVESGEADGVLWISAYRAAAPDWMRDVPTVALTGEAAFPRVPRVHIAVGRPGLDHDSVEHDDQTGALTAIAASAPSEAVSVARAISDIAVALSGDRLC